MFYSVSIKRKRRDYDVVGPFFGDHPAPDWKRRVANGIVDTGVAATVILSPGPYAAQAATDGYTVMKEALDPIISMVQGSAYWIAYLWMLTGAVIIITGNRSKGLSMIKMAGIGYIVVQFVPTLMDLVHRAGTAAGHAGHR